MTRKASAAAAATPSAALLLCGWRVDETHLDDEIRGAEPRRLYVAAKNGYVKPAPAAGGGATWPAM